MDDAEGISKSAKLSRMDWIAAAFDALADGGIGAVRVEALARQLGVSKGSFYWHFANRAALTGAMLDEWERLTTDRVIDASANDAEDAPARLLRVLDMVAALDDRLDPAIRGWAATDGAVARRLQAVDRRRIGFLECTFREMGFAETEAHARARLVYTSMVGEQLVLTRLDLDARRRMAAANHAMLIRPAG